MAKHVFVVFTEAQPGREAEFNAWYDNQHVPDVLKVPGFRCAQRFRVQPAPDGPANAPPRFMALYEIETDDLAAVMAETKARAGTAAMPISDAMNAAATMTVLTQPLGERVLATPVEA